MNQAYRLIWNHVTNTWVVVSEIARSNGKRSSSTVLAAGLILAPAIAFGGNALPSGGNVIRGQAAISQSGSHMQVNQTSRNAVLNWNDFSLGKGASIHFNNADGATLNRVTGNLPSSINGSLTATGSLYLVNRNGVIVGSEGVINAAGFMATTLDVRDDEFMAGGGLRFFGDSRAGIVNLGNIQANSGNVALVAHSVRNTGTIQASQGAVELLAGQEVFLASPDSPGLLVSLGEGSATADTGVTNVGLIEAAQARLQTADGNLYNLAINQAGVIRASGVSNKNGRIVLTADGGTVRQDGVLSAHNANGSGGEILVGGDFQGKNAAVANASHTEVTANARMKASATAAKGDGGRVIVWADDSTSFAGRIAARGGEQGGDGGFVEVSGKRSLDFRPDAPIDLSAAKGKTGTVLLDPDEMEIVDNVTGANQIAAAGVEAGLASANYLISTASFDPASGSGDINVNSDIAWNSAHTLTLQAGNMINIDANITAVQGALDMQVGRAARAPDESGLDDVNGGAWLQSGKTIWVDRLRYGASNAAAPAGYSPDPEPYTDSFDIDGNLSVNTLELDLTHASSGLETGSGTYNIAAFNTIGNGPMGWVGITNHGSDLSLNVQSSAVFGMQIVTPGDLTLEAGSQLASDRGEIVLASTGGNFINQAGANALVLSGTSRFLIYTGSQAGTSKGGLSGTEEFSRTFVGNPPEDYNDDTSRFLYRAAFSPSIQELTYRADNLSRFYGNANPGLSYSVSGLQNGDLLGNVVTGAPLLYTTATMQSGVGQYAINISQGTLASASYGFQFVGGTLTVNAAPVQVNINNASRFYGDFNPAFSATASGLKNGDSLASALVGWNLVSSATRASGVGGYAISASRNAHDLNPNYSLSFTPGTLTIQQTPVTLSLGATSMVYGSALPNFHNFATLSGTYNGDTVASAFPGASFTTLANSAASVGSYAVNLGGNLSNPNYQLSIGSLGELSITKAPLVIHAHNASRLYGDANPAFSLASATGWRNGDTLESILPDLLLTSSATATSNVGAYAIVPTGSATNYEFVAGSGLLTVNKAPLEVWLNAARRYYGDADPHFSATYNGLKNGETTLPGLSPVSNTNQYTPVGDYVISAGGTTTFQNYLPTFYAGVLTVAPRPLLVTVNNASRTYGELNNPVLGVSVSGATAWDAGQAASFWVGETSASQRSDAGDYAITPTLNPYGDNRFDNLANYAVTFAPGILTINRALAQIRAKPQTIIWGDGLPPLDYDITGWLMPWDDAATVNSQGKAQLTSLASHSSAPPGLYAITLANSALGNNYYAVLDGAPMVQVLRRPITIVGDYLVSSAAQIREINPGRLEPVLITRYDSNGRAYHSYATTLLPGGPQFSILASSDGTRGGDLFSYVGMPFIEPAPGSSLDEVFRYYDVTSKPGVAQVRVGHDSNDQINRDWQPPEPEPIVTVDRSGSQINLAQPPSYEIPAMGHLIDDVFPDNRTLIDEIQSLFERAGKSGPDADAAKKLVDAMSDDVRIYLNTAMNNENGNQWYIQTIAETEQWLADLARTQPRPANYDSLVAKAEADIIVWRKQLNAFPSMDGLRQKLAQGDADTVKALMPLITSKLMRDAVEGTLTPDTENALVRLINQQRYDVISQADAAYEGILEASKARGLHNVYSAPKIRDIIGEASVEVGGDQMKQAAIIAGGAAAAVVGGAAIAGVTLVAASMPIVGLGGQSMLTAINLVVSSSGATYTAGAAGAAGVAAPAIVAVIAAAIGTAEAILIAESTNNYDRYVAYKENNQAVDSLSGLNLNNKDHVMQLMTAISAMATASLGSAQ
ncbi:filamentous hemagglutinin N-terminal domain-containing protein [Pseudothauera nasutitermitis]|uniref:Filamentous hemagglutinin N-terminal domain-containing protein n=1 Tax=Pseudothauera nasutitermitis TaxID=2565930 RepID=A0A4S4B3N8_9RHOO|nr:MBG domain-containing protein [Pseudothauera nasutitermitis]THF67290.1 filamentous hemagglutinin N-terminal domain-containing protein [Pseudothauera nasutitermitis]